MLSFFVLGFCFAVLVVTAFGCCFEFPRRNWIVPYVACVALSVGALAYLWEPYSGSDLSRYFIEMRILQREGMSYFPNALYSNAPITNWLLYFVAQTGDYHLYPAITASVSTAIILFVAGRQMQSRNASSRAFFLTVTCAVGVNGPLSILIGGRQHLAIAFMLLAVWYDCCCSRKKLALAIGLYLAPILIHSGTVALYLARLVVLLGEGRGVVFIAFAAVVAAAFSGPVLTFLSDAGVGGELIAEISEKYFTYQESEIWDWRIHALIIATSAAAFAMVARCMMLRKSNRYVSILFACLVFSLCYAMNYHLVSRVLAFVLYGFFPVVNCALADKRSDVPTWIFLFFYLVFSMLSIAYQCVAVSSQWHVAII